MDYSIIVPTLRSRADLGELIAEIEAAEPGIHLIVTGQQGSPACNRNRGLNQAATPVVVMVDDDIRRMPSFFARRLVETLMSNPQYAVVSAKLINPDGRVFMGGRFPRGETGVDLSLVGWAPSACLAIYRTEMRFDETLPCFEDVDYCMQLTAVRPDAKFAVNNDVRVLHLNEEKWRRDANAEIAHVRFRDKWGKDIPH